MKKYLLNYFNEDLINEVLNSNKYKRLYGVVNSPKSKINEVDINVCKKLYEYYKLPIYKIAMLYGVSDSTMRTYFLKNNITLKGHKCGKNSDNSYFEKINSFDKAYFLGLIFADGNLYSPSPNKRKFQISLTSKDAYILEKLNIHADLKTSLIENHKEDLKSRFGLYIDSFKIYEDLYKLGVEENKSSKNIYFPKIPKKYYSHFIRGYFDGDGIAYSKGYIGFCGSYTLLKQIHSILLKELNLNNIKITYNRSNNIYYMTWASKADCYKLFNYLYKDKKDLYLIRKYEKLKQQIKNRPSIQ